MATVNNGVDVTLKKKKLKGSVVFPASIKGLDGDPGVWVGTEAPPDDSYQVWVDPTGGPTQGLVTSVNDKTGDVKLDANDVGALDASELLTNSDILAIWNQFYKGDFRYGSL